MASLLPKRQKRPIILISDDEDSITQEVRRQASKANSISLESKSKSARERKTDNFVLPSRHHAKTRSATLNSRLPASIQPTQTTAPKKPAWKRGRPQKTDPSRSLYTPSDGGYNTQRAHDESHRGTDLSGGKIEEEDFIEDDSFDEELANLVASQTSTRSVLDRRKREFAPIQSVSTSKYLEAVPSGSQKFIIPGKILVRQDLKESSSHADLRPWAERYGPQTLEEIMVHKKKVADVQAWLKNCMQGQNKKVHTPEGLSGSKR